MNIESKVCETSTASISTLLEKFITHWNEKNIDCLVDLFTDNAEFTDIAGQVAVGKQEIKKQHEYPFSTTMKKAVLKLHGIYARALTNDMVIVTTKWNTEHNLMPDGQPAPDREGIMQIIAKGTKDTGYKIQLVHNTDLTGTYKDVRMSKEHKFEPVK